MAKIIGFSPLAILLLLTGCQPLPPSSPMCRAIQQTPTIAIPQGQSASCLIRIDNQLLLLKDKSQQYNLPRAAVGVDETAQCAAHRAVWQQTGLNIEVGKLLVSDQQQYYFDCRVEISIIPDDYPYAPPMWSTYPEGQLTLRDPFEIPHNGWLAPLNNVAVLDAFNAATIN